MRLAGGSGPNEGRVEFCYRRVFGTVCGSQWDTIDAQVICRQFGYPIEGEKKIIIIPVIRLLMILHTIEKYCTIVSYSIKSRL